MSEIEFRSHHDLPNKGNRIFTSETPLQLIYLKQYAVLTASVPDFIYALSTYLSRSTALRLKQ